MNKKVLFMLVAASLGCVSAPPVLAEVRIGVVAPRALLRGHRAALVAAWRVSQSGPEGESGNRPVTFRAIDPRNG